MRVHTTCASPALYRFVNASSEGCICMSASLECSVLKQKRSSLLAVRVYTGCALELFLVHTHAEIVLERGDVGKKIVALELLLELLCERVRLLRRGRGS